MTIIIIIYDKCHLIKFPKNIYVDILKILQSLSQENEEYSTFVFSKAQSDGYTYDKKGKDRKILYSIQIHIFFPI